MSDPQRATQSPTLVISDGGLPALVALAIEADRAAGGRGEHPLVMPWTTRPAAAGAQSAAVASQARYLAARVVEPAIGVGRASEEWAGTTLSLVAALQLAAAMNAGRIVWPVHFHATDETLPQELDRIAGAADRALLIGRLSLIDRLGPDASGITIEPALVDLTDAQIADLVIDLDCPAYLVWWWRQGSAADAEHAAAAERRLWLPALRAAGWIDSGPTPQTPNRLDRPAASGAGPGALCEQV